jgi:hypothetical protein
LAVGKELEHFYEVDLNGIGNELRGFLKQFPDFAAAKGVSTESSESRNLLS